VLSGSTSLKGTLSSEATRGEGLPLTVSKPTHSSSVDLNEKETVNGDTIRTEVQRPLRR
jgi:hypothetical protein